MRWSGEKHYWTVTTYYFCNIWKASVLQLFPDFHKKKDQENPDLWIPWEEKDLEKSTGDSIYFIHLNLNFSFLWVWIFSINRILDAESLGFIILILYLIAPGPRLGNLKKKHHKLLALGKSTYSDDEEEEIIYFPIKRWFNYPNEDILMPEDMTEGLLNNDFVSNKLHIWSSLTARKRNPSSFKFSTSKQCNVQW